MATAIVGTVRTFDGVDSPSQADLMAALRVINNQRLSIWQQLYANGLTIPGGETFCVERIPSTIGETLWLMVKLSKSISPEEFGFKTKSAEGVVEKAQRLLEAVKAGKRKCHSKACCPLATIRECVCEVSFTCPNCGSECHGSHD